jgi:hypothetical protein
MNIIVIANCHVGPICEGLALSPEVDEIFPIPIHLINTDLYRNALERIKNSHNQNFTVLQFDGLLEKTGLDEQTLARVDRVLTFTNIYFTGLHPDLTYVGDRGRRIYSPIGDYHSKICVLSFVKGYSLEKCEHLFNVKTYEELDFFEEWNKSHNELNQRDLSLDIKFSGQFLEMVKNEPTLYSVNHPLVAVFNRLINQIFMVLEVEFPKFPDAFFYNHLASDAWWPVYAEINEFHFLKQSMSMSFKSPNHLGKNFYNLTQFLSASYKLYNEQAVTDTLLPPSLANYLERI